MAVGAALGLAVGILLIAVAIFMMFFAVSTALDEVNDCIFSSKNPEYTRAQIEMFLQSTPDIAEFKCDRNYVCGRNGSKIVFGETDKLVWVYHHIVKRRVYFITVTRHEIVLCFTNGEKQYANVQNEQNAMVILHNLIPLCPKCIFGYSKELEQAYQYPKQFLELKYAKVEAAMNDEINRIQE